MDKVAAQKHSYIVENKAIYQWEQTLTEVNIYIDLPPGIGAKQLEVTITPIHLTVGIKGNPPYLDKDLAGAVKTSESFWTVEDGVLNLQFTKAESAITWPAAISGHQLQEAELLKDQKQLMIERFQAENPGFDFSGAEFTGNVPDPKTFMSDLDRQ